MDEEPRKLRKLLRRVGSFALSKRERPQIEDIVREAYEMGREDMRGLIMDSTPTIPSEKEKKSA